VLTPQASACEVIKKEISDKPEPRMPLLDSGLATKILPGGVLRHISVSGKQIGLNRNESREGRAPVILVREASTPHVIAAYEHVEILGAAQLVTDYQNPLPNGT